MIIIIYVKHAETLFDVKLHTVSLAITFIFIIDATVRRQHFILQNITKKYELK